jgi:hypothetical protein
LKPIALFLPILMSLPSAWSAPFKKIRVAVCQIPVIDSDREGNFRRIEYALERAEAEYADLAVFPESSILGWENPEAHQMAYPIPGADSNRLDELARKYKLMIAIGIPYAEGRPEDNGGEDGFRPLPSSNLRRHLSGLELRSRQALQTGSNAGAALWFGSDERDWPGHSEVLETLVASAKTIGRGAIPNGRRGSCRRNE